MIKCKVPPLHLILTHGPLLLPLPFTALRFHQPSTGIIHKRPLGSTLSHQCQSLMCSGQERRNLEMRPFYFPVTRAEVDEECRQPPPEKK